MSKPVDRVCPSPEDRPPSAAAPGAGGPASARARRPRPRRGVAGVAGRVLAAALALGGIGLAATTTASSHRQPAPPPPPPMTNSELEVTLLRANISPEALAAAGFTGADTSALVGRARSVLAEDVAGLRAADSTLASRRELVEGLQRRVRSGLGREQDVQDLAAARTALASAEAALASALGSVRTYALGDGQSPARAAVLSTIRGNGRWRFPTRYLCKAATEAEWVRLRDALSIKRQAERDGEEVPAATSQLLASWEADAAVSAAAANLSARGAEVKTAWDRAIAGTP